MMLDVLLGVGLSGQMPSDLMSNLPDLQILYIIANPGELL